MVSTSLVPMGVCFQGNQLRLVSSFIYLWPRSLFLSICPSSLPFTVFIGAVSASVSQILIILERRDKIYKALHLSYGLYSACLDGHIMFLWVQTLYFLFVLISLCSNLSIHVDLSAILP